MSRVSFNKDVYFFCMLTIKYHILNGSEQPAGQHVALRQSKMQVVIYK